MKKDGRVHKPRPEVRRVSIRFAKDSWSYRKTVGFNRPRQNRACLYPGGRREVWIKPHRRFWLYWWRVLAQRG
jgi:putative transposase